MRQVLVIASIFLIAAPGFAAQKVKLSRSATSIFDKKLGKDRVTRAQWAKFRRMFNGLKKNRNPGSRALKHLPEFSHGGFKVTYSVNIPERYWFAEITKRVVAKKYTTTHLAAFNKDGSLYMFSYSGKEAPLTGGWSHAPRTKKYFPNGEWGKSNLIASRAVRPAAQFVRRFLGILRK